MKLWIIYKNGIGFSKIIAELLQDRLEDYIDVDVGNAKKIDPGILTEEKFDYLIIGDIISKEIPSLEIQNWLLKFGAISNNNNFIVKLISGFYISSSDIKIEPLWGEFLLDNVKAEIFYPPILQLKVNKADFELEDGIFELIKDYSNYFIEFLIEDKKKK